MESARTLKANLKLEGKPCGWCQVALRLGEDATVCNACEKEHHSRCWDGNGGCSTQGCVNAPLRRLDAPAPGAPPPPPPPFGSPFPQGAPQYGAPSPYGAPPQYGSGGYSGAPGGAPPPGYMVCPNCRAAILAGSQICPACRTITTPDGMYHGPKMNAPGAVSSMVLGIIGMVFCGIILGPIAIIQANNAKRAIANDPSMGGQGFATAGTILGVLALVINAIGGLVMFGGRH